MLRRHLILAFAASLWATYAAAAPMGDDGLHKPEWLENTFLDLREDLEEATDKGQRLLVLIEQRGCIYCNKMHEEIFPTAEIDAALRDDFFVVQLNMFGDREVVDFDGTAKSEKDLVRDWGLLFTPTMMFFPQEVEGDKTGAQAAVAVMPGAFGEATTRHLLDWVRDEEYQNDEGFQKYHARRLNEEG